MLSGIGKFVIDSITILDDTLLNLIVTVIVGWISYILAYKITGNAYLYGVVESKSGGSFIHWIVRIGIFLVLSIVIRWVYSIYNIISSF